MSVSAVLLRTIATWVTLAVALAIGAAPAPAQAIRRIALSPLGGFSALPDTTATRDRVEQQFATRLVQAGYESVPAAESAAIRRSLLDSVGGYYSRLTGELIEAKYLAVEGGTMTALRDRFGTDAWLRLYLVAVPADFSGGKARWDGTSEGVAPAGHGTVMALSLAAILLRDVSDTLFVGRSGIQVLQKVEDGELVPVKPAKLLTDQGRIDRACKALVDSLVARLRPKAGP
jgi:hypothetical protein